MGNCISRVLMLLIALAAVTLFVIVAWKYGAVPALMFLLAGAIIYGLRA